MNPRVSNVTANEDYSLMITFTNGEVGRFDVSPYLSKGIFRELQDKSYFRQVAVVFNTVQWPHGQDFCPDTLYEDCLKLAMAAD